MNEINLGLSLMKVFLMTGILHHDCCLLMYFVFNLFHQRRDLSYDYVNGNTMEHGTPVSGYVDC